MMQCPFFIMIDVQTPAFTCIEFAGGVFYVPKKPALGMYAGSLWGWASGRAAVGIRIFMHLYRDRLRAGRNLCFAAKILVINLSRTEYDISAYWDKEWFFWNCNLKNRKYAA